MENNQQIPEIDLDSLSREEQKVIIAQDVIANVKAQIYIANKNRYMYNMEWVHQDDKYSWEIRNEYLKKDVKSNWNQIKSCEVCAMGACILSITKYKNHLTFEELPEGKHDWYEKQINHIVSVFTTEELCLIELMFEGNSYEKKYNDKYDYHNVGRDELGAELTPEQIDVAITFYKQFNTENERLIGIMQSIIDNQGQVVL